MVTVTRKWFYNQSFQIVFQIAVVYLVAKAICALSMNMRRKNISTLLRIFYLYECILFVVILAGCSIYPTSQDGLVVFVTLQEVYISCFMHEIPLKICITTQVNHKIVYFSLFHLLYQKISDLNFSLMLNRIKGNKSFLIVWFQSWPFGWQGKGLSSWSYRRYIMQQHGWWQRAIERYILNRIKNGDQWITFDNTDTCCNR